MVLPGNNMGMNRNARHTFQIGIWIRDILVEVLFVEQENFSTRFVTNPGSSTGSCLICSRPFVN